MAEAVCEFSLVELAEYLNAEVEGDTHVRIRGLADLSRAEPGDISFLSSKKYRKALAETRASAVVMREGDLDGFEGNALIVNDPYEAYARLSQLFETRDATAEGIHPSATVHPDAVLGEGCRIGPNCVIGAGAVLGARCELMAGAYIGDRCVLGDDVLLFPNVVIYHEVQIGHAVTIHANTTIGSDGFGFAPGPQGWIKIHQIGRVIIGNHTEIGASTTIDRGALEDTRIGDHVIIDNQVHIAHNCEIGEGSAIAGCTGIAGSTKIGKRCLIGGSVGINGHISIADDTHFHGGTVVTRGNTEAGEFASQSPMQPLSQWRKNSVRVRQLDDLFKRVKALENKS